jgi:hypothetical protein
LKNCAENCLAALVAAVALAAAWGPLLRAPFLFDDHVVVERAAAGAEGLFSGLAHYNLAYDAWRNGRRADDARAHFKRMVELRPDFAQGLQAYVNFMSETDGSAAAVRWLDARIAAGGSPFMRKMRGALRSAGGDLRGAEEDFRACLAAGVDSRAVVPRKGPFGAGADPRRLEPRARGVLRGKRNTLCRFARVDRPVVA